MTDTAITVSPYPPAEPPVPPARAAGRPWRDRTAVTSLAVLLAVAGGLTGGVLQSRLEADPTATPAVAGSLVGSSAGTGGLPTVAAAVAPSVVTVLVDGQQSVEGSGVVLSTDGLVVTNNHVVSTGGTVSVRLADGRTVPAGVVGTDPATDLALLRVRGVTGLTAAVLGTAAELRTGDTVLAFGSPLGLAGTVTAGIVSAVGRDVDLGDGMSLSDAIQTDAAINAGNSGGALVDTAGRVVGVNVAIATTGTGTGNIGVGFAIGVDTVRTVVDRLAASA